MTNEINMLLAQNPNFKFVKVLFSEAATKLYTYKTLEDIKVGDKVVVPANENDIKVVIVEKVCKLHELELNPHYSYRWVMQKLDLNNYEDLIARENEAKKVLNESKTAALINTMNKQLKESIGTDAFANVQKLIRL